MSSDSIECHRCGRRGAPLERPPFRSELGERIRSRICPECWADWLKHQTVLINHYGLDPRTQESRQFLYGQIETVLLGDGEGESIDTTQKGSVHW